jgi:hypothetical protein
MIVVIQCAASKRPNAGYFRRKDGKRVLFVANPALAPASPNLFFARPDDCAEDGNSWREHVRRYNVTPESNPFGLSQAYELYENETYRQLVRRFGLDNTMILSAGWGLIPAQFLTPRYDITFSASAEPYARRRKQDAYRDFSMLPVEVKGPIVFFGGREYLPLFSALTAGNYDKVVFYNSAVPPTAPDCILKRFSTRKRTNWHYECALAFADGARLCP